MKKLSNKESIENKNLIKYRKYRKYKKVKKYIKRI